MLEKPNGELDAQNRNIVLNGELACITQDIEVGRMSGIVTRIVLSGNGSPNGHVAAT